MRYARDRLAGLDETGERGAEPKYTAETNKRIFGGARPAGAGRIRALTGPLIAAELGDVDVEYVWRFLRPQKIDLCGQGGGDRRALSRSARRRAGAGGG